MTIRPATPDDIDPMIALARESASASQWPPQEYRSLFSSQPPHRIALIASDSNNSKSVLGFLIARHLAPEWELENIVVTTSARRKGTGNQLLIALIAEARETNSDSVFLEVRESNVAARALYEKSGFRSTGRRKSYYSNPLEDAILYCLNLDTAISS